MPTKPLRWLGLKKKKSNQHLFNSIYHDIDIISIYRPALVTTPKLIYFPVAAVHVVHRSSYIKAMRNLWLLQRADTGDSFRKG